MFPGGRNSRENRGKIIKFVFIERGLFTIVQISVDCSVKLYSLLILALTSLLNSIGGNQSPVPTVTPQIPDMGGLLSNSGSTLRRDASGSASNLLGQVGQYVPPQPDSSDPMLSDHLDSTREGGRGLTEIASLLNQTSVQLVNGLSRSNSSSPATVLQPLGQYYL